MTATMSAEDIAEVMNRPYAQELLASRIPARLAYTGSTATRGSSRSGATGTERT